MPEFYLGPKAVTLRPTHIVGSGGEADIYRLGNSDAYKVFKPPTHQDFSGSPALQNDARERIAEHQRKLPALMALAPRMPAKVPLPLDLLRDKTGLVVGYKMNFIDQAEVLLRYGERGFRDQGVPDEVVKDLFVDLHKTVDAAHKAGFVFGDFNDLNVLAQGRACYVIDSDSGQFGSYVSRMFTGKFVDPLICDPKATVPVMTKPHSPDTDWYAYVVMLMQCLLFVGPYGGVYRPADLKKQVPHDARPLRRITIFDKEIRYPKPARHFSILPDDLLQYFDQTFAKDKRGTPPLPLIERLRFTTCSKCGKVHMRGACPECVGITAPMVKEVHTGTVSATKVFETGGQILFAAMQRGRLRYLYHEGGAYRRDGGSTVVAAPLEPRVRYRIHGDTTLMASTGQCLVFDGSGARESITVDSYRLLPLIDANAERIFWAQNGALMRSSPLGVEYPDRIGDILQGQTLFWAGDELGFGFYRAAELSNFFVFRTGGRGINDSVNLPSLRGQLVDSTACLAHKRVWFMASTQEQGKAINRCHLLDEHGVHLGSAEGAPGDGSWLGSLRGKCAAGHFLLAPTDDGIVRAVPNNGALEVDREFRDTQRFVNAGSHLFIGDDGVYVVERDVIWKLTIR
jgi:hypothetical protein